MAGHHSDNPSQGPGPGPQHHVVSPEGHTVSSAGHTVSPAGVNAHTARGPLTSPATATRTNMTDK